MENMTVNLPDIGAFGYLALPFVVGILSGKVAMSSFKQASEVFRNRDVDEAGHALIVRGVIATVIMVIQMVFAMVMVWELFTLKIGIAP